MRSMNFLSVALIAIMAGACTGYVYDSDGHDHDHPVDTDVDSETETDTETDTETETETDSETETETETETDSDTESDTDSETETETETEGPVDADGDGFTADVDCDDYDADLDTNVTITVSAEKRTDGEGSIDSDGNGTPDFKNPILTVWEGFSGRTGSDVITQRKLRGNVASITATICTTSGADLDFNVEYVTYDGSPWWFAYGYWRGGVYDGTVSVNGTDRTSGDAVFDLYLDDPGVGGWVTVP